MIKKKFQEIEDKEDIKEEQKTNILFQKKKNSNEDTIKLYCRIKPSKDNKSSTNI